MTFGRSRRFGRAHRTSAEHSAGLRPNVVCQDERLLLVTGEYTEQPKNVVVSYYVST